MKKINYQSLFKNIVIYALVFFTGFIGTILLIDKQKTDLLNLMINGDIVGKQEVKIFGLKAVDIVSVNQGESYNINIIKSNIHDFLPFIIGLSLVIIAIVLTYIVKKILKNKYNN